MKLTQSWSWGGPWRQWGRPEASWWGRCWGYQGRCCGLQGARHLLLRCGGHEVTWADWQNAPQPSSLTLEEQRHFQSTRKSHRVLWTLIFNIRYSLKWDSSSKHLHITLNIIFPRGGKSLIRWYRAHRHKYTVMKETDSLAGLEKKHTGQVLDKFPCCVRMTGQQSICCESLALQLLVTPKQLKYQETVLQAGRLLMMLLVSNVIKPKNLTSTYLMLFNQMFKTKCSSDHQHVSFLFILYRCYNISRTHGW